MAIESSQATPAGAELRALPGRATANEIAELVSSGRVSAREIVEAHLERIREVNPALNAVVVDLSAQALERASDLDTRRERGEKLGRLAGVPITIKESLHLAGTPSSAGATAHREPAQDTSPLVQKLIDAGAVVLGKTNVAQCLLYHEADNPVYGRSAHPTRADRTPGGSSGGEAAIVASGGSALGLGTDVGGSLRVPAHFSGVHALKPTPDRLSLASTFEAEMFPGQSLIVSALGPIARSVSDLRLAMDVLSDASTASADATSRGPSPGSVAGLRIVAVEDDGVFPPAPAVRRATKEAAAALSDAGADVDWSRLPETELGLSLYFSVVSADGGAWVNAYLAGGPKDSRVAALTMVASLPSAVRGPLAGVLGLAGQKRLAPVVRSMGRRSPEGRSALASQVEAYRGRWARWMAEQRADAVLLPPHPLPALRHGASYDVGVGGVYSILFNLLAMPAGVVSTTTVRDGDETTSRSSRDRSDAAARRTEESSAGLPVGVQVAASPRREDIVLTVMSALEAAFRDRADYPASPLGTPEAFG